MWLYNPRFCDLLYLPWDLCAFPSWFGTILLKLTQSSDRSNQSMLVWYGIRGSSSPSLNKSISSNGKCWELPRVLKKGDFVVKIKIASEGSEVWNFSVCLYRCYLANFLFGKMFLSLYLSFFFSPPSFCSLLHIGCEKIVWNKANELKCWWLGRTCLSSPLWPVFIKKWSYQMLKVALVLGFKAIYHLHLSLCMHPGLFSILLCFNVCFLCLKYSS